MSWRVVMGTGWQAGILAAAVVVSAPAVVRAQNQEGDLQLRVRRLPNAVELVIEGTGAAPQLQQSTSGNRWQGDLQTSRPTGLRQGPQRLSLPEVGMESVTLDGSGSAYRLEVTPTAGLSVPRPVVSADGRSLILSFPAPQQAQLQLASPNMTMPGRVPQPTFVPPLQQRATAPPVGDMAVGSMMLANPSYVNVSGPPVTMTMKNAPVTDVLMALARIGGYGFVYVDDQQSGSGQNAAPARRPVSITFSGENYGRAVNSALMAGGLQGRLEGRVILAGPGVLGKTFGPQLSKVYRLNQVSASSAADYLASLGATINKVITTTTTNTNFSSEQAGPTLVGAPNAAQGTQQVNTAQFSSIDSFGSGVGPLRGLIGTTDSRLSTITLVGDSRLVSIAENYLKQLDLRQRQVALAVRILDVDLSNAEDLSNSFAVRWGNTFIVNDGGQLLGAFGRLLPPRSGTGDAGFDAFDFPRAFAAAGPPPNPGNQYPRDTFFNFLRAQIQSRNTKLLASPTLILQDNPAFLREGSEAATSGTSTTSTDLSSQGVQTIGLDGAIGRRRANEGVVRVGTNVVVNYDTETPSQGGNIVCTPELATAGLVLGARIEKIDDNGFVSFTLSPSVSAITEQFPAPQGCGAPLNVLSIRSLDTGSLRVRDGQTLILTGVISDFDRAEVSKWPILGDIPLIGSFFRGTTRQREKRELVIMVTPRIISDDEGGVYGYGWQPGTDASREFMGQQGGF